MALAGNGIHKSQFFITTKEDLDYLDNEKYTVFGCVSVGMDVVQKVNDCYCDEKGRPYRNVRIKHVYILHDPFPDPKGMDRLLCSSPSFKVIDERLEADDPENPYEGKTEEEIKEISEKQAAISRTHFLEMVGDLPSADAKPPDEVLFICKLNPDTEEEDLEIIFSKFGKIVNVDIIRDYKTGESLNYGFIEFKDKESCFQAYVKMDNAIIDDRRIHVDFCQSVSKIWNNRKRGIPLSQINNNLDRNDNKNRKRNDPSNDSNRNIRHRNDRDYRDRDHRSDNRDRKHDDRDNRERRTDRDNRDRRHDDRDNRNHRNDRDYRDRDHRSDNRDRKHDDRDNRDRRNDDRDKKHKSSRRDANDDDSPAGLQNPHLQMIEEEDDNLDLIQHKRRDDKYSLIMDDNSSSDEKKKKKKKHKSGKHKK